ncbi:alpha-galactosidase [Paenibacillus sp. A51L]
MIPANGIIDLSTDKMTYRLNVEKGLSLREYGRPGSPLVRLDDQVEAAGCEFALVCDGVTIDGTSPGMTTTGVEDTASALGVRSVAISLRYEPKELDIVCYYLIYENTALVEKWMDIRNAAGNPVTIGRIDSFVLPLPRDEWRVEYYASDWGAEFEPRSEPLAGGFMLETRFGRSSKGTHPWMTLYRMDGSGQLLTVSPMWSGNWVMRGEAKAEGGYRISGGLHDWEFAKVLQPGGEFGSVHAAMALGNSGDPDTTAVQFARVGRKHWYPHNAFSRSLPVEWNHWWSYEDRDVNEENFRQNAESAASLGMEVVTLDAGWFGPSEPGTEWYDYRGDWELVNAARFPGGIRPLSDRIHGLGLKFGLWCEIEAAGKLSSLGERSPAFVARRDGEPLGYVCFGNPEAREWAFQTLDRLIADYGCDWVKLDFNLDPQAGCNCTDHGHGPGDGLYEHYTGYYSVLDRIRERYPDIILENCSSGGLRIDLGMMRHTHLTFLSDPDWPEHSLQVFWGAVAMLAPDACLHWSYSEWRGDHPSQTFNPRDPLLTEKRFDYYTRISMLRGFGFSQKLSEMPERWRRRIADHVKVYKETVRMFVREADLYRLTGQPLREGGGERWAAFQYSLGSEDKHLLFTFRLPRSPESREIRLKHLDPDASYQVGTVDGGKRSTRSGRELMAYGIRFADLEEEESELLVIKRIGGSL